MSTYQPVFIGRHEAIDLFYSLRSLREQKNALYIEAEGGLGKTWLLREYVEECRRQRRPWYTGIGAEEDPQNAIIDFYYLENRTVAGLRRSIARRLGKERFPHFWAREEERQALEGAGSNETVRARVAALEREIEALFFNELRDALRQIRNYTLLLFDTFEVVHNRRVGRWFLETFLPHPATRGYLVVFAGRRRETVRNNLPLNVHFYELQPFSRQEAKEYFKVKYQVEIAAAPEEAVIEACERRPLLMDLAVEYMDFPQRRLEDIGALSRETLEQALVGEFLNPTSDVKQVLHEIAYLKRRYTRSIFEHLRKQLGDELDFAEIESALQAYPFVKYRPEEGIYSLHDEFQRMIADYAGRDWQVRVSVELYPLVVEGWYTQAIAAAPPGPEKDLLQTEQLEYILETNFDDGLELYKKYFKGIQSQNLFRLNDMLWGSVYEQLQQKKPQLAFELTQQQARWLFETSQAGVLFESARFSEAAFWLRQLTDPKSPSVQEEHFIRDRNRLAHCYFRLGDVEKAAEVWEQELKKAEQSEDKSRESLFMYNLGHARYRQGNWQKALELYERALEIAESQQDMDLVGEILFVLCRLRAHMGATEKAITELNRSYTLITTKHKGEKLHAQLLVYGGDICRYAMRLREALDYYEHSLEVLEDLGGLYDWKVRALAGLGAVYTLMGSQNRRRFQDIQSALNHQEKAFEYFREGLSLAREFQVESYIMVLWDHMAEFYEELYEIECLAHDPSVTSKLRALINNTEKLPLLDKEEWRYLFREQGTFAELDTPGRAQRLFELAMYQSDKMSEPHLMFDALVNSASIAQRRNRQKDIDYYLQLAETLRGTDDPEQENIFFNYLELIKTHMEFDNDPEEGIKQYSVLCSQIAKSGSFGEHLVSKQFSEIQKRLQSLPYTRARSDCKKLEEAWQEIPLLFDFIKRVQDLLYMNNQ